MHHIHRYKYIMLSQYLHHQYMYRTCIAYHCSIPKTAQNPTATASWMKLDSRLLCNARGASRLAKRFYILIRALELTLQGQPRSNVVVQITRWKMTSGTPSFSCSCRLSISMFLSAFLSHFTQITQWKMTSATLFFNWPCTLFLVILLK